MTSTDQTATDDYRTWTFSEDEGGVTEITISATHLTVERTTGPDCDGYGSNMTYSFVTRPTDSEWPDGTHVRPNPRDYHATDVLVDGDPCEAWDNYVTAELGHYLSTRYLLSQPSD